LTATIGHHVVNEPASVIVLLPTQDDARSYVVDHVEPIFGATPALRDVLSEAHDETGRNTLLHRRFPGGSLRVIPARSPRNLRAHTCRVLLVDELDALYGFWAANFAAFNGDVCRDLAIHFLELAKKQEASIPLVLGHNMLGVSLFITGDIAESRSYLDQGIAHYDPAKDRLLSLRIGQDARMTALIFRSWAFWILGFPKSALTDADEGLQYARELNHAGTLMLALSYASLTYSLCGEFCDK
jgi:Phage terminase large subunit (GpA)